MRRMLPGIVGVLMLLSACGDDATGPSQEAPEIQVQKREVTVEFGDDLSSVVMGNLESVYSIVDAVEASGGAELEIPNENKPALILAVDGNNEPLLASFSDASSTVTLDEASTAAALVRTMIPRAVVSGSVADLDSAIRGHAQFPTLVTLIRDVAEAGESYAASSQTLEEAVQIAIQILEAESSPSSLGPADQGASDLVLPFAIIDEVSVRDAAALDLRLVNESFIHFAFAVVRQDESMPPDTLDQGILDKRPSSLWEQLFGDPTARDVTGVNAPMEIRLGQNTETVTAHQLQIVSDAVGILFDALGLAIKRSGSGDDLVETVIARVGCLTQTVIEVSSSPTELVAGAISSWVESGACLTKLGDTLTEIAIGQLFDASDIMEAFLKAFAGPLGKTYDVLVFAQTLGDRVPFYADLLDYWGEEDLVVACQTEGELIRCVRSLELIVEWEGEPADPNVDLHLLRGEGALLGNDVNDCTKEGDCDESPFSPVFRNQDWGRVGDPADDPQLIQNDEDSAAVEAKEVIVLDSLESVRYAIWASDPNDQPLGTLRVILGVDTVAVGPISISEPGTRFGFIDGETGNFTEDVLQLTSENCVEYWEQNPGEPPSCS